MKTGHAEGAIRHQTTKTHPVLNLSLNKTLRSFSYAVDGMEGKEANLTNFKKTVNSLNEFVGGSGNLLNQKSLAIAAACGRASDANWLKHCIPGSSHHFTRLKQPPFFFTSPDQVMQLVHRLSVLGDKNGPMNGPKVDEVLCKTLRGTSSDAMFHDIVIRDQDLFYTTNSGANLSVMCRRSLTREEDRVETGGFTSEPQKHYQPKWSEMGDATEYSSLEVFMSSHMNYVFNITCKPEKKIEKEPFHSNLPSFDIHQIQVLLNKNLYFALKEPYVFVADYLSVDPEQLRKAISVNQTTNGGYIATVSQALTDSLDFQVPYVGILETTEVRRRPLFGIMKTSASVWSYQSSEYAIGSLLIHLLFNTRMEFQRHWTKPLLENTKELAFLFPIAPSNFKTILVCALYRDEGYVWAKQFHEVNCRVMRPFVIANYYTREEQVQRDMLH
jgi:hypothetical protein